MNYSSSSDRVILEGVEFYAYHGVNPEERALGQPFLVDLEAHIDLRSAGISDDIDDTVNYSAIYREIKSEMDGPSKNLLETVAEAIARRILECFPVTGVKVRVRKTKPPIKGAFISSAGVEIYRGIE